MRGGRLREVVAKEGSTVLHKAKQKSDWFEKFLLTPQIKTTLTTCNNHVAVPAEPEPAKFMKSKR